MIDDEPGRDRYDEVIDRVFRTILAREADVARERSRGRELYEELAQHPPSRQQLLVANSSRFRKRALGEMLLEQSHEAGFSDPERSAELAHLGVTLAGLLAEGRSGEAGAEEPEGIDGLQARAWAQLGNALRIRADHAGAERAFLVAAGILESGQVSPLETARVLDLQASLKRDQRRFGEAVELMDRVISLYRKLGQKSFLGRALKQKSMICGEAGDLEGEISLLRRSLELLSPDLEPRTFLAARHNLISALCQAGRPRDAFALLFHTRPLYLKQGDRLNILRLRWLEGTVALGLQRHEQAAVAFHEVREAFLELGLDYDAALASLDLTEVYALQGRTADVRRLAEEMLEVFQSRSIHREALGALSVLQQAARLEKAGILLVREVSRFLKKARTRPELQFDQPPF